MSSMKSPKGSVESGALGPLRVHGAQAQRQVHLCGRLHGGPLGPLEFLARSPSGDTPSSIKARMDGLYMAGI